MKSSRLAVWMIASRYRTVNMKAEQSFPVILFLILYKVVLTFKPVGWKFLKCAIQVKRTEQYFPVVLFIMLYKVVLTFKPVYWMKMFKVCNSNEGYCMRILSCGTVYYAVQGGSNFWAVVEILKCAIQMTEMKATESTSLWCYFMSVDKMLKWWR